VAALAAILVWVTFGAGGVYSWVWMPAALALLLLAGIVRPAAVEREDVRAIDCTLLLVGLSLVLQLTPMPAALLTRIDPQAAALRAAIWLPIAGMETAYLPISILPRETAAALGILACGVLTYWVCRQICESGGAGRIVRAVAVIGLIASLAALVQRVESRELLYGIWRPLDAGARPYGPFVNRNHFATWAVMALPLVFGYLLARTPAGRPQRFAQQLADALKQLGSMRVWLVAAMCLMTLAVLISTSRSGLIGLMAALITHGALSMRRRGPRVLRWTIAQALLLAVVALSFANFDALVGRLDETLVAAQQGRGRGAIWADARRLIGDFAATGTGAGTFGAAIAVYQTAEPGYSIGQAHNHYLQLAAEGGLLVGLPVAMVAIAFLRLLRRRLREDVGSDYLLRTGAVAGIVAAFVQSFWETGLRMPANAMLLAVLAAIATFAPVITAAPRRPAD